MAELHVVALSGGKDSTAMALRLRELLELAKQTINKAVLSAWEYADEFKPREPTGEAKE